ncbi:RcnB family protein [Sphingomonas sp. FW199]|uniref:RcnB family protein n=1 Tax=Sphingomonas sp. FW199 TaxID=3400217 RepID=UPI003CE7A8EA
MRKPMLMLLMAAVAVPAAAMPTAASAQSWRELRDDRRDVREERRELRDAYRRGDRGDIREERRDLRRETRDLRRTERQFDRNHAWRDNDWRDYRASHRGVYARGNWRAPFRYNRWNNGARIAPAYFGQRYWISDPWRYRLPPARGFQYVRHYDDVLLVDTRRGGVVRVYNNFFW